MRSLWSKLKYWLQIFLLPLYFFSYAMPRSKKIWAFGSSFGRRFADNPRYFYLYINQYQKKVRPVWISKNKEIVDLLKKHHMEAYYLYTIRGILFSLRAKVYIYDNYSKDISFTLSGGAVKINMWHGIPLKKIQMDNQFDKVRHPDNKWKRLKWALRRMTDEKPSDYILTTSKQFKKIFSSAFHTKKVIVCGYPRNDILLSNAIRNVLTAEEKEQLNRIRQAKEEKIVLYMPTFRESEGIFFDIMNLPRFNEWLRENKMLFCIKAHPKSKIESRFGKMNYSHIFILIKEMDPYPFLNLADVLVTDYSSVYFDYLLKDKPIIFFDYDKQEYLENSREFYFDYNDFTPGSKVETMQELEDALLEKEDHYAEKRNDICKQVFYNGKRTISEKLYKKIKNMIEEK